MDQKEQALRAELQDLESKLQDPTVYSDKNYPKLAKRKSQLEDVLALFDEKAKLLTERAAAEELKNNPDSELQQMALTELTELEAKIAAAEAMLTEALTPQDPNNERDVIMEIR